MQNPINSSEQTYRTLMIIWFGLLMSQLTFFAIVYASKPELLQFDMSQSLLRENPTLIVIFAFLGLSNLALSFFIGKTFITRAIEEQKVTLVQTAMIIGCALSESVSLLGLFLAFAFSYQFFFAWIVVGILGMIYHFPKRADVHAASFKKPL